VQILVVDDDPLELFLSLKIIRLAYQAEGFKTLPEAVEWAKANPFDVLLSDYYISKQVLAPDVLKAIIEVKGKTFKSFVLTNYIDQTKVAALKEAGFDSIIEKPLSLENIKKALET
jgi:DNA-binding NtrC family response regulator